MKILITGYTTRMWGSERVAGDYLTFSFLLEDILKMMGHQVERRKVMIGEEISRVYDFAFCGVAPLSSITAGRVPETHYVMDALPGRHAVYADDWSFCGYGESVTYTLDRWGKYLEYKKFPYKSEILEKTKQSLELMMDITAPGNNAPVLCPMFSWGDHGLLIRDNYSANLVTVDPSCFVPFPTIEIAPRKNRIQQWVMAALSDHSRWVEKQNPRIRVEYVGNKRMGIVLTETQTIRLFANSYGVLSAGYPSAGSGWWRTRYLNAAWAETPIYSDPRDAQAMGGSYRGTMDFFENLDTDTSYNDVVESQNAWLQPRLYTQDMVFTVMERLIEK